MACMKSNPNASTYTPAEWKLLAFTAMVDEKVSHGQITKAEGDYLMASYISDAKGKSDKAEAAQRRAIGEALEGAGASLSSINPRPPMQTQCMTTGTMTNCTTF